MGTPFAHAGKIIADRFELTNLADIQPESGDARAWIARDRARSLQLRAIVLDPAGERVKNVIDAARRAAFITSGSDNDPSSVSIISVVSDDEDHAIFTELPPGTPLSSYLSGEALDPKLVQSIMGEVASAVNSVRHHGIRHLQLTPSDVYLTDSGNVVIDGYGIKAALAGIDTSRSTAELDREEARGLTVLLAHLLLGRDFSVDIDEDAANTSLEEARWIEGLPDSLDDLLRQEIEGAGATSPDALMLRLVPWGDLDPSRLPAPVEKLDSSAPSKTDDAVEKTADHPEGQDVAESGSPARDESAGEETAGSSAPSSVSADVTSDGETSGTSAHAAGAIGAATALGTAGAATGLVARTASSKESASAIVEELLGLDHDVPAAPRAQWPQMPEKMVATESEDLTDDDVDADVVDAETVDADAVDAEAESTPTNGGAPESTPIEESVPEEQVVPEETDVADTDSADDSALAPEEQEKRGFIAATSALSASATTSPGSSQSPEFNHILSGEESGVSTTRRPGTGSATTAPVASSKLRPSATENDEPSVNATVITITLLSLVVLAGAFFGLRGLFQPFDEVTLADPDANVTTSAPAQEGETSNPDAATTEATPEPEPLPTNPPVIASVSLAHPEAGVMSGTTPQTQDNPQSISLVADGEPGTRWNSWTYNQQNMAPISGFGIHVQLEEEAVISEVVINDIGQGGGNVQLRDTVDAAPSSGVLVAEAPFSAPTVLTADEPFVASEFVLWFTELPVDNNGGFQLIISEITVN